ncbi:MAG TPA: hypothetical protein VEX11_07800 [Acetobacteraceae bacterium]|nr:hypothetical protein [Acetobacteraceae bacterium]
MTRTLCILSLLLTAPAAFGQGSVADAMAPDPGMDGPTCGRFVSVDSLQQAEMLRGIQPLGDEIDASDGQATRQWAAEVTRACGDHGDRPLADAAREALGE